MSKDDTPTMEGEVQDVDPLEKALVKINVTRAVLDTLRKEAESFPAIKTQADYEKVRRHRLDMVPLRTTTVKEMKRMREEANAFAAKVIAKEKEITGDLATSEAIDQAKEDAYLAELKAIEDEKARVEEARVDALIAKLTSFEWAGNRFEVAQDSPVEFATRLEKARETFRMIEAERKVEAERLAKEEQDRIDREAAIKAEEERQAIVRKEQERAAAELQAKQDAFERQQREAAQAEEDRQRKIKEDSDRAERERLAKIAEDERKARETAEAETRRLQAIADQKAKEEADAKAAEAEKARLAALAPDKEKIMDWIDRVKLSTALPKIEDVTLAAAIRSAQKQVVATMKRLETLLN